MRAASGLDPRRPPTIRSRRRSRRARERTGGDLLVVLDQFEEYFLYHPADAVGTASRSSPAALTRADLPAIIPDRDPRGRARALERFKGRVPASSTTTCGSTTRPRAAREAIVARSSLQRAASTPNDAIADRTRARRAVLDQVEVGRCRARRLRCGAGSPSGAAAADRGAVPPARPGAPVGGGTRARARACCGSRRSSASAARNGSSARTSTSPSPH